MPLCVNAEVSGQRVIIGLQLLAYGGVILIGKPQAESRAEVMVLRICVIEPIAFRSVPHQTDGDARNILWVLCREHQFADLRPESAGQFQAGNSNYRSGGCGGIGYQGSRHDWCIGGILARGAGVGRFLCGRSGCIRSVIRNDIDTRGLCLGLGLPQIVFGDTPVIGVLAVAFLDHVQRMTVPGDGICISLFGKAYLRVAGQCGGVMCGMLQMTGLIDIQCLGRVPVGAFQLVLGQQGQRQICMRAGHIDILVRVHARCFDDAECFAQLKLGLIRSVRFAVEH